MAPQNVANRLSTFGRYYSLAEPVTISTLHRSHVRLFSTGCSIDGILVCFEQRCLDLNANAMTAATRTISKTPLTPTFSIVRLICTCLGLVEPEARSRPIMNIGTLSQVRVKILRDRRLMAYLLLREDMELNAQKEGPSTMNCSSASVKLSYSKFRSLAGDTLGFLLSSCSNVLQIVSPSTSGLWTGIHRDTMHGLVSYAIIGHALLSSPKFQASDDKAQLQGALQELVASLKHIMLQHEDRQELIGGLFDSFAEVLPSISSLGSRDDLLTRGLVTLSEQFNQTFFNKIFHPKIVNAADTEADHGPSEMDAEDDFDSQKKEQREEAFSTESAHSEISASTNSAAFRAYVAAKICFMSSLGQVDKRNTSLARATSSVIDYLTSLSGQDFLASRAFILEILGSDVLLEEDDASIVLQYLAQVILRSYEFERSEVSLGLILDVMTSLVELWTTEENNEICSMGKTLYIWFINTALERKISSPHVLVCMSTMLQKIIKIRPEYGTSIPLPSARTSLFKILHDGNIPVKFHIGCNIADTIGLFILRAHEKFLEDVIDSLPNDPSWIEGIALRLFILSHLAASWSTLLRRCIYAILECPKHAPESAQYAKHCLLQLTAALKLPSLQDLFKLFVPQIFYTWLESESLRLFPYTIFGYQTFSDLLQDVQDEVVGQIAMRGRDDEADQLAEDLNTSFKELLEQSFGKTCAYCIARDVAMPSPHAEARIRKILGKEQYASLVTQNFANVLATFFRTMDPDGQVEKGFQKQAEFPRMLLVYEDILSKSGPDKALPVNQQPSFKARYIVDEIDYLCRRARYDVRSLWTPDLYVFIFREMLSSIHEALGSLHACHILRKVRILVSIVEDIALEQYPLEMALQSLKIFLTDPQCAEEAIGLVQYLLQRGISYLQGVPSFLAGLAVHTLASMKSFFESTQDSTTQESQFIATMTKAQSFHSWFIGYLNHYESSNWSEEAKKSFRAIVDAASHMQIGGNARLGTYESELLLEVLEDQRSGRNLLDQSCRDSILIFLCNPFQLPLDFRDDILGSDEKAYRYASIIWSYCRRRISSLSFCLWVGRVLGRAYAGRGLVDRGMNSEMTLDHAVDSSSEQSLMTSSSSTGSLLRLLCSVLHDEDSRNVGIAEMTLRSIVTQTDGSEHFAECDHHLPTSIKASLLWTQEHLPNQKIPLQDVPRLNDGEFWKSKMERGDWIRKLCIALTQSTKEDPILPELSFVIQAIEGLAEKAFPYVLHLVLLEELNGDQATKRLVSEQCRQMFRNCDGGDNQIVSCVRIILQAVLYLRTQPLPNEASKDDRSQWLDIDYRLAASAAISCSMFNTALLFLELDFSRSAKSSRRSSSIKIDEPSELLLGIYEKIDEQDAFYGVQQPSSLSSMMARLEYEHAGFKSLSFRGAHYDGQLRSNSGEQQADEESMVQALDGLDLNGLSQSLLKNMKSTGPTATDSVLRTARKLEQWDVSAPTSHVSSASTIFQAFQGVNNAEDLAGITTSINSGYVRAMDHLMIGKGAKTAMHDTLGSLAILTEVDEVFSSRKPQQVFEVLKRFENRSRWMHSER